LHYLAPLVPLALLPSIPARALDPARSIAQYQHSRWMWNTGVPAPIFQIVQGRDGHLWLAAGVGLYRFDALGFEKIEVEGSTESHGSAITVLAARNGDIWTWFARSGRFAVYRDGALRLVAAPSVDGQVTRMVETPDGAIWAGIGDLGQPLLRRHQGRWERVGADWGLPRDQLYGMVVATDGALWVSYINSVHRLAPGARRFQQMLATPEASGTLTADKAGQIWLSDKNGTRAVTGPGGVGPAPVVRFPYPTDRSLRRGRPIFDRDGNLWIALRSGGLERLRTPSPNGASSAAVAAAQIDHYRAEDGLTSDRTNKLLEDREGNIWVATSLGLDRFRPAAVAVEPLLTRPAAYGDILLGASDGSVYVAQADSVYRVAPGGRPEPYMTKTAEPEAMCEAPDRTVWTVFADRIVGRKDGTTHVLTHPRTETGVYDCAVDRRGDLWLTAAGNGMYRYRGGRWEAMFGPTDEARFHPTRMIADARHRPVVLWNPGTISWIDPPNRQSITVGTGKPIVRAFDETPDGLLVLGNFGLARVQAGRARLLPMARIPGLRGADGIVQTPQGDIWAMLTASVARITTRDFDKALSNGRYLPPVTVVDFHQGLPDRPTAETGRGIVHGGDGRVWFATQAGTVWIDPAKIDSNPVPPGVAITALTVGERRYRDPKTLSLPSGSPSIEIDFAALSLSIPELVKVRYRLEGVDQDWIDPGKRRQAFYTNLAPGQYRFQVIAANDAGVWNRTGAVVTFEVPPTFLQSRWFALLCGVLALLVAWLLFRVRLHQVANRMRRRLEERHGERERIARDLHDTLLQSVQGLILRFQAVANDMPGDAPSRQRLESALERADDVLEEGRDSVRILRARDNPGDLQQLVREMVASTLDPSLPVRVVVEGRPRAANPLAALEIARIGREALFNIARHAKARSVEINLSFGAKQLGLRIRDDGVGIPDEILARGQAEGHYGLPGMRERAEELGGSLSIDSTPGAGTDVSFTIPARLAYVGEERKGFGPFSWPLFRHAET
jgi:signal transduction histidine kinase/ligand-binding sensor domain-containing protein